MACSAWLAALGLQRLACSAWRAALGMLHMCMVARRSDVLGLSHALDVGRLNVEVRQVEVLGHVVDASTHHLQG